jgi:hypothetical protein
VINHCDRHITLLCDIDTVIRHRIISHCDRRITLPIDTNTVQSETERDKSL